MSAQASHGKRIEKLCAELNKEARLYLSFAQGKFGEPNEFRKQYAIVRAYVTAALDSLKLDNFDAARKWLAARPSSGLIVK
jgi:hypothetical protein